MKKITRVTSRIFFLSIFILQFLSLSAQSPQSFQYQAVVRDAVGNPVTNQNVRFQISIISGSITGTIEYVETHLASTNTYGIVTLSIGIGIPVTGSFSTINWGGASHFIKLEADPAGGTSYLDMGTTQLLSVPYSLYSENAGNIPTYTGGAGINVTGTTITNTSPDQTVTLSQGGATTVSGTYPNFTISSSDLNSGTPGGLNKTVQYNNNGTFAGDTAAMVWDNTNKRLGVGSSNPSGRVVIKGNPTAPANEPLFEVKNSAGQQIMAIYNDSIHFFISDMGSNKGGFAVSGRNNSKALTNDFLRINADSTRIWTTDTIAGFGVKNIGLSSKTNYMKMTPDNYMIGHLAGRALTTGKYNSFIGYQSGYKNNSGNKNYFIGYRSGYNNLSGYSNIFIGDSAGFSNTTGMRNVFIGNQSGLNNLTGNYNVFLGYNTGMYNTASNNVFVGYLSGLSNTTGTRNAFLGFCSGRSNTTGTNNIFIGDSTGCSNTTGNNNTAIGGWALASNVGGAFNTAYGFTSLHDNTTGSNNTGIGTYALYSNTTGYSNTSIGYIALGYNTIGHNNTATGHQALNANPSGNYNTANGSDALRYNTTGSSNTAIGESTLEANTTGSSNTALGYNAFLTGAAFTNSTAIGATSVMTANNKVRLGNASVTVIEGQVAYTFPSDGRFKIKVTEEVKGLDFIRKLRPIVYNFDTRKFDEFLLKDLPDSIRKEIMSKTDYSESTSIRQTGFIAQEVEQAAKESGYDFNGVHKPVNEGDNYSVAYSLLTVPLVKAVQEQQLQIEALKLEIKELKELINKSDN